MRLPLAALALALALALIASPTFAQTGPGGFLSLEDAGLIARDHGVAKIKEIELNDGVWEVEGRDANGHKHDVDIDAATGAVIKIDRD